MEEDEVFKHFTSSHAPARAWPLTGKNTHSQWPHQSKTALPICYLICHGNLALLYSTNVNGPLTSLQGDEVKNTCENVWSVRSLSCM